MCYIVTTMVQWNHVQFWDLKIPKPIGSNPGHGSVGDWASTWGNGTQMNGLPDRRSLLGGFL